MRIEFYNIWDSELKLTQEEDDLLREINTIISNNFSSNTHGSIVGHGHFIHSQIQQPQQVKDVLNDNKSITFTMDNTNNIILSLAENDHLKKIQETFKKSLADIEFSKSQLLQINKDIDFSFNKLIVILECRNELSSTLKEFNNSTKTLIQDQEK